MQSKHCRVSKCWARSRSRCTYCEGCAPALITMAIEFLLGEHVAASLLRSSSAFAAYPGRAGPRRIADSGRKHTQENDTMALGSDQIGCVEKSGECAGMQDEVKVVDAKMR
jgi:hypothetical protein